MLPMFNFSHFYSLNTNIFKTTSMVFTAIKETSIKWFGSFDYHRLNYMIFILGWTWMLKRKYIAPKKIQLYYLSHITLLAASAFLTVSMLSEAYTVRREIEKISYSLSTTVFFLGSIFHYLSLTIGRDELEKCLELLDHHLNVKAIFKSESDLKILESGNTEIRNVTWGFWIVVTIGLSTRGLCHLASSEKISLLPFPYSEDLESPYFEILFLYQSWYAVHFMVVLVSSETVAMGLFVRIIKHFEVLEKNINGIEKIFEDADSYKKFSERDLLSDLMISNKNPVNTIKHKMSMEVSQYRLLQWRKKAIQTTITDLINHHQCILNITKRVNWILWGTYSLQIIGGGLFLALSFIVVFWESQNLSLRTISQFIFAGAFLFNTFILCFYGSRIETGSQRAADALYFSPWYQMDGDVRKKLVFFLKALWMPPVPKAGNFVPLNLNTFLKFLNLIYNCMAVMQNMVNKHKRMLNNE